MLAAIRRYLKYNLKYLIILGTCVNAYLLFVYSIKANDMIRIAILDTGLDLSDIRFKRHLCSSGHSDATNSGMIDRNGHGTHVAGSIVKYAEGSNFCLIIIKGFDDGFTYASYIKGLAKAIESNATVINISGGGGNESQYEWSLIQSHPNIAFIVAAGNNGLNLDATPNKYYPASYPLANIITIGSAKNNKISSFSNYGSIVDAYEDGESVISTLPYGGIGMMSGTSMSTSIYTGKYVKTLFNRN